MAHDVVEIACNLAPSEHRRELVVQDVCLTSGVTVAIMIMS